MENQASHSKPTERTAKVNKLSYMCSEI